MEKSNTKKGIWVVLILIIIVAVIVAVYFVSKRTYDTIQNTGDAKEPSSSKYQLTYEGKNLTPWQAFSKETYGEPNLYSEIPSCAFDGVDKEYKYSDYTITTSDVNGTETIYSAYLDSDAVTTPEGVKVSDEVSVMLKAYGEGYEQNGTEYIYKDGNVMVSFITENDVIISITYTMITDKVN